jgi:hypothetical protein
MVLVCLSHFGVCYSLLGALSQLHQRRWLMPAQQLAATLGRNSLAAFVAQAFVYYSALGAIRPTPSAAWPLWFAASLAAVLVAVVAWERAGGPRLLTVGLPALVRARAGGGAGAAASG